MSAFKLAASGLLLLATYFAPAARAQYHTTAPVPNWYDYGVMRQQMLNGWSVRDKLRRRGRQSQSPPQRPRTTTTPTGTPQKQPAPSQPPPQGGTTFSPVAPALMPERLAERTPAHREEALRFYDELLKAYAEMARTKGAPLNDVARAASFAVSSFYYVHQDGRNPSGEQMDALRRQMSDIFSGDENFQQLTARRKQEIYETYIIQAMLVSAVYEGASQRRDGRKVAEMRAAAREGLEELFGVSADRIQLTRNGVELR